MFILSFWGLTWSTPKQTTEVYTLKFQIDSKTDGSEKMCVYTYKYIHIYKYLYIQIVANMAILGIYVSISGGYLKIPWIEKSLGPSRVYADLRTKRRKLENYLQ